MGDERPEVINARAEGRIRPIEVLRCWSDNTWDLKVYMFPDEVEVPSRLEVTQRVTIDIRAYWDPDDEVQLVIAYPYTVPERREWDWWTWVANGGVL